MEKFSLIKLPYAPSALEPVISAQTISFHYGKHLQAYVDNLNKLLPGSGLEDLSLEEIVRRSTANITLPNARAISNNAGQVLNHNLYFTQFTSPTPHTGPYPGSALVKQIERQWGTLTDFQSDFEAKCVGLFGSGWVWLQANSQGELSIGQYANADNPVTYGLNPLLTFDVWEHAYYLDYQNRRADYLHALWKIVNWTELEVRFL